MVIKNEVRKNILEYDNNNQDDSKFQNKEDNN